MEGLATPDLLSGYRRVIGRVLVLAPDVTEPTGGVKKMYEYVDALVQGGVDACIVHRGRGFSVDWFDHSTPVISAIGAVAHHGDVVVVPEYRCDRLLDIAPGVTKVVLNQRAFIARSEHFSDPSVASVVVVSDYDRSFVSTFHPSVHVDRVRCGIDSAHFRGAPRKRRRIAYMPRREGDSARVVLESLRLCGSLDGWEVSPIDGQSSHEVATILAETEIFLSFSRQEGFGLPPLEAMSAGCLVVGFHGYGGREYFDPRWSIHVPEGDLALFAQTLRTVVDDFDGQSRYREMQESAAEMVRERYTPSIQDEDVRAIFSRALDIAASGPRRAPVDLRWAGTPRRRQRWFDAAASVIPVGTSLASRTLRRPSAEG